MKREHSDPEQSVNHPRYGKRPRITGLNPAGGPDVHFHPHTTKKNRIANTAIRADLARQKYTIAAVTHYLDVERSCRDCQRPFIFFAAEQKHWY